jgi:CubicO group peptidase (beta-lactamase class C family)
MRSARSLAPVSCLILGSASMAASAQTLIWPGDAWQTGTPDSQGMSEARLQEARTYALTRGGSGFIARRGVQVYTWGSQTDLYDVKSVTKSIGSAVLAFAIGENKLALADKAQAHLASFGTPPDTNAATGWLADILTTKHQVDLATLMRQRVFEPLGIDATELTWRANQFRDDNIGGIKRRELASGINANVDALARLGLFFMRDGVWRDQRILPEGFVAQVRVPAANIKGLPIDLPEAYPDAPSHYGVMWWTNGDGRLAGVPKDAYWGWGLHDHLLVVIPSLDLVVVRTSANQGWRCADFCPDYALLEPLLNPIVASVANAAPVADAGADQSLALPTNKLTLNGTVRDEGLPLPASLTITWSVVSGTGVTIASPNQATTEVTFANAGEHVLELKASDGALTTTDQVKVTVAAAPAAPTVSLAASPTTLEANGRTTLTWSSTNASACTASGAWQGGKGTSGEEQSAALAAGTHTFTLECTGAGGSAQQTVTVTANAPAPPPPPPPAPPPSGGGGGGGGSLDVLQLASLLLLISAALARQARRADRTRLVRA